MVKLFGHPMSTCTRKVITTLVETQVPYEMTVVALEKGEHKREPHLSRQPFGRVPAIEDEGFAMFESRAICRYLNDKYKGNLVPAELRDRAAMDQWISIEMSEFSAHVMKFVFQHVLRREQAPGVLESSGASLEATCRVVDKRLSVSPFFAGATFSIADICYMPYVEAGMMTPVKDVFGKHPHLMAWWGKVSERPSWQRASLRA